MDLLGSAIDDTFQMSKDVFQVKKKNISINTFTTNANGSDTYGCFKSLFLYII